MARRRDPETGNLLPEGISPITSERTGDVTYRARISYGPKSARRHKSKTYKRSSEAIRWLRETQIEVNLGTIIAPDILTCNEYFESWYARMSRSWSGSRSMSVNAAWNGYAKEAIGDIRIQRVHRRDMQRLVDSMTQAGRTSSTIELYLIGYSQMFRSAIADRIIQDNPCSEIQILEDETLEPPIWTPLQIQKFLQSEYTTESQYFQLWTFLIGTCCRIGEALALQWGDIDFDNRTVWIHRTVTRDASGEYFIANRTKSGKDGRILGLEQWVIDEIQTLPHTESRVFGSLGHFTIVAKMARLMRSAAKRADLPEITPHGLRHASSTAMAMNGVEESIVQEILGHRPGSTVTRKIYIHVNLDSKRKGTSSLAMVLGKAAEDTTTSVAKLTVIEPSASEVRQNEDSENYKTG